MTVLRACLALLVVADPIGAARGLARAAAGRDPRARARLTVATVATAGAVLVVAAGAATTFLDLVHVTAPDAAVAAGILALVPAYTRLGYGRCEELVPPVESARAVPDWRIALVPLAMPLVAGPAALAVVVALGANHGTGAALVAVAATIAATAATFRWLAPRPEGRARRIAVRVVGLAMIAVALDLAYSGIFVA
jgi:multiple antibiotic resistance protein